MTHSLLIGQKSYSSWSLRGWLAFAAFDIPVQVHRTLIYGDRFHDDVRAFGGHRSVPVVRTPDGAILSDSLAIAWHLAETFPDRGLLPQDALARAGAQSLIAEMHSGFTALRSACPMNLRTAWAGFVPSDAVRADLARIEAIWATALDRSGGPFLHGAIGLADVFYAPVCSRLLTYGLPMSDTARAYVAAIIGLPQVRHWRAEGLEEDAEVAFYDMAPLARLPFPAA